MIKQKKLKILDLFCGAGGAGAGYHNAGFDVVGIDIKPQHHYPFEFHQADALEYCAAHSHEFDAIHASPPCQRYSTLSAGRHERYPDLYKPVRDMLIDTDKPWVIENVIGAPYDYGIVLCGSMFDMVVRRHRNFETSWLFMTTLTCNHEKQGRPITITGNGGGKPSKHSYKGIRSEWPTYMQMSWATPKECTQAIPPAYTRYIGSKLKELIETKQQMKG